VTFLLAPVRDAVLVRQDRYLAGLIVKDLTFDGDLPNDRYGAMILDVRGTAAALFERVHFRTWVAQAGHGAPVGVTGLALLAFEDCWFTGAVRREPSGHALSLRGPALYRFERCRFSDLPSVVAHTLRPSPGPRSLGLLEDCVFDNSPLVDARWANERMPPEYPILVQGGRVLIGWNEHERGDRLDLWRARGATSVRGLRFENEVARCTVREMRKVLDGYTPPPDRHVVAVEVYTWLGCDNPGYGIFLEHPRGGIETRLVHLEGDRVVEGWAGGFVIDARLPFRPGHGTTLRELLAKNWDDLDHDRPVGRLYLARDTGDNPLMEILDRMGRYRKVYR
jgi:hypothetical protein